MHDNLILIDNIPFDKINHFEGGSSEQEAQGGRFSVFTAGLVEQATFYGGGFGSEYGRKGASVLDLSIVEGNTESPTINGTYDLLGLELNYDGPAYPLENTSLVLNVRDLDFSYAMKLGNAEDYGDPTMGDVIAKTTTYLNARNKISLLAIYSTDRLIRAPHNIMKADDLVENDIWDIDETRWLFGLNWRLLTSQESVWHNTFFYRTNDRYRSIGHAWADAFGGQLPPSISDLSFREGVGVQNETEAEVGWKSDFHYAMGKSGTLNGGIELYRINLDYDFTQNGVDTLYQFRSSDLLLNPEQKYLVVHPEDVNYRFDDSAVNFSAYSNLDFSVGQFVLTPGLRYSHSGFSKRNMIAPRLQVRYRLAPGTTLNLATGIYYQKPLNLLLATDPANKSLRDEKSTHVILGLNQQLRSDLRFTLEGYHKSMDDLITPGETGRVLTNSGDGWTRGVDASLLKRFTSQYYGQMTYSFAASKRNDRDGLGEYNSPFNAPHNLAAIVGYEVNKNWFLSGKWKYAVGRPKDRYILHENVLDDAQVPRYSKEITARNADRISYFHNLVVRVDNRRQMGPMGLITFFEINNLFGRLNSLEDRFSELTGEERARGYGGVSGNAGFKLEF